MDADDVGVREPSDDLCFSQEAGTSLLVGHQLRPQDFHGKGSTQARVAGQVDLSHPSDGFDIQDLKGSELLLE